MRHFRVYLIGSDGHIKKVIDLQCEDDDEARTQANQVADGCVVELWQSGRQIAVIEK